MKNIPAILWGLLAGGLITLSVALLPEGYGVYAPFIAGVVLLAIMAFIGPVFDFWDYGVEYFRRSKIGVRPSEASMDKVEGWAKRPVESFEKRIAA
jgi:hypothetical protein